MDVQDFGDAMRARKRRSGKSKRRGPKCRVERVRGGRFMLFCPHKRPRFVSKKRAAAFRR